VPFSRKQQDGFTPIFLGFRKKHFFITTCIEKHCVRPLMHFGDQIRWGKQNQTIWKLHRICTEWPTDIAFLKPMLIYLKLNIDGPICASLIIAKFEFAYRPILNCQISVGRYVGQSLLHGNPTYWTNLEVEINVLPPYCGG